MTSQIRRQTNTSYENNAFEMENDSENVLYEVETEEKFPFWDKDNNYQVDKLLKNTTRNLEIVEIKHELGKDADAICMYRFASNYNGAPCKGCVLSGICVYHWSNLGISFTYLNARILDNVETGSNRVVTNRFTPFFINTHGKGNIIISPIMRSILQTDWITNKNKLVSLISACYTLAHSQDEANAMAKGLLTLIFGTDPQIFTVRNIWLKNQKILTRLIDPDNIYQFIIQKPEATIQNIINVDNLSIFDTPLLLTFNVSTVILGDRKTNLANPANISMFQVLGDKSIGVFSIVGPIIYAPVLKNQYRDKNIKDPAFMQQHIITYANIAGATSTARHTILPMNLSTNNVYLLDISESKQFTNEYWDSMGNVTSLNSLSRSTRYYTNLNNQDDTGRQKNQDDLDSDDEHQEKTMNIESLINMN